MPRRRNNAAFVSAWRRGRTLKEVAAILGAKPQTCAAIACELRKQGVTLDHKVGGWAGKKIDARRRRKITPSGLWRVSVDGKHTDEMLAMRNGGATLEEIGKKFGITRQAVHQRLRDKQTLAETHQ